MEIWVKSPDEGIIILAFLNPANSNWVKSNQITVGCTADEMKAAIKGFYSGNYGVDPIVTLSYRAVDGETVLEQGEDGIVYFVYQVEVPTAIARPSVETIMIVPLTSFSTIEFVYPTDI